MEPLSNIFRVYGIYIIMVVALAGLAVVLFETGAPIQLSSGTILADCAPDDPACIPGYGTPSVLDNGRKTRVSSAEEGSEEPSDSGVMTETRTKTRISEYETTEAVCPGGGTDWTVSGTETISSDVNCTSITVTSTGTLVVDSVAAGKQLEISAENLTVQIGGIITADSRGCPSSQSPNPTTGIC